MPSATNSDQDQDFVERLPEMGLNIDLGKVFEYISNNFQPDDVFPTSKLAKWAADKSPNQIFNYDALHDWATEHGYFISGPDARN